MLGKLVKHEFKATYKMMGLFFGAVILMAILTRMSCIIPDNVNVVLDMIKGLLMVFYVLVLVGSVFCTCILLILRFYQNMLQDQGYLTHTLPVKVWQQLVAKVFTYFVWIVASFVVLVIALTIFMLGNVVEVSDLAEFLGEVGVVLRDYPKIIPLWLIIVLMMLLQIITSIMNFIAAMSLGQLFGKHRVLGSVVSYIGMSYVINIISGVFMMVCMPWVVEQSEKTAAELELYSTVSQQISFTLDKLFPYCWLLVALQVVMIGIYFFISNFVLSRKLNLE